MSTEGIGDEATLVRRLDVTARIPDSARELTAIGDSGLLIEQLIGRYVLNRDARVVWTYLDGRRTVREIAMAVATEIDLPIDEVLPEVKGLCRELSEIGLIEPIPR